MEPKSLQHYACCNFLCFLVAFTLFHLITNMAASSTSDMCNGSIAECNEEYEALMESEMARRFLEQQKYISPGALKRDQPACKGGAAGQSYSSSCLPPSSNPENRGCSKYYRCRSD